MKTLALIDGEIYIGADGQLAVATGAEGLRQKLETRLKLYRGEWFLDRTVGVPYVQKILGRASGNAEHAVEDGTISQIFDAEILKEKEVIALVSSEAIYDANKRTLAYNARVNTIYGEIKLEVPTNG